MTDARDRVIDAAMTLFGRQGFRATTVAQIAAAAGLSPGAGGIYRHFSSKRQLLEEGLRRQIANGRSLIEFIQADAPEARSQRDRLFAIARAGLRRLEEERDLNRLLLRDLAAFPDLLAEVRDRELRNVHATVAAWLRTQTDAELSDPDATAAVLMGAVSHYWIVADVFAGEHPLGVSEDRYLAAVADLAACSLRPHPTTSP